MNECETDETEDPHLLVVQAETNAIKLEVRARECLLGQILHAAFAVIAFVIALGFLAIRFGYIVPAHSEVPPGDGFVLLAVGMLFATAYFCHRLYSASIDGLRVRLARIRLRTAIEAMRQELASPAA